MPQRRRATSEFEQTQSEAGPRVLTLDSLVGGYNGYTSPDLLTPQFWVAASQVYAGQFGTIRRIRWAPFFNSSATGYTADGTRIVSMASFQDLVNNVTWVVFENNDALAIGGPQWLIQNPVAAYSWIGGPAVQANPLTNTWEIYQNTYPSFPLSPTLFYGPYSRTQLNNFLFEGNGLFRGKILIGNATSIGNKPALLYWGIDAPDVSPQIALTTGSSATIAAAPTGAVRSNNIVTITTTAPHGLSPGQYVTITGVTDTTFNSAAGTAYLLITASGTTMMFSQVGSSATSGSGTVTLGITKTVGRSYAYAWENANTGHVSAPSPVSQFVKYNNQTGTITCIETGTISVPSSGNTITGTGTNFSTAWIGKALLYSGGGLFANAPIITAVTSATSMTVTPSSLSGGGSGLQFQIRDPQATHIRLYATGDGQPVYFLIARNSLTNNGSLTGLTFTDTANSEPPNAPFSSEISQIYNVPPPIGQFVDQYQGRPIVYGVAGALQTFFYGNIEATVVGQAPESFAPLNTVTLPLGDGKLFGSANLPTGFILWSNRQDMFKLTGLLSDNTIANAAQLGATIQRLPYAIGCASPHAKAVTPLGAIWLSSDREVWLFTDHYAPKNIGKPVQDVLNRINGARLPFAKMTYYKRGERSWLTLAVALDSLAFNNKLLVLDLDLLASNGQPSYFTFDMATNSPTWYQLDINCEGVCTSYDGNSVNHLFVGDVDLITDADWQPSYFTIGAEQNVPLPNIKLHAFGNEDPHMIKTFEWMRALTNQIPKNLAAQGWAFSVDAFDDDTYVIGVNPRTTNLIPGADSNSNPLFLEYSPAKFRFGGVRPVKGRRFQIGTTFPTTPGLYELRGFEVAYTNLVGR